MLCVPFWRYVPRLMAPVRAPAGTAMCLTLVALASQGCGGSGATGPITPTGILIVTMTLPPYSVGQYDVEGPDSYDYLFRGTDTIGVDVGTYVVENATASSIDPIVTSLFTGFVTGSPAIVGENDTARASIAF